ncbi:MAG TPA: hypothetical protein VNR64_18890 [Vicinamibacterales bacterium]|nr:hypothetical protein [Vicinamibacterales bacterium]
MTKRLSITLGFCALLVAGGLAQTNAGKRTLRVAINYTGSGTVDASHRIYVALWDTADLNNGRPVAVQSLDSKSGPVTFSDVQKVPAYATTAFDPTGAWKGDSAPPSGSSLGMYSKNPPKPEPIDVTPGKTVTVRISFNDSVKVP